MVTVVLLETSSPTVLGELATPTAGGGGSGGGDGGGGGGSFGSGGVWAWVPACRATSPSPYSDIFTTLTPAMKSRRNPLNDMGFRHRKSNTKDL